MTSLTSNCANINNNNLSLLTTNSVTTDLITVIKPTEQINLVDDNDCINPLFANAIADDSELEQEILEYNFSRRMLTNHKHIVVKVGKDLAGYGQADEFDLLILPEVTISKLLLYLRYKIKLYKWQALFLLVKNKMLIGTDLIVEVYNKYVDDDILVIDCHKENVFG